MKPKNKKCGLLILLPFVSGAASAAITDWYSWAINTPNSVVVATGGSGGGKTGANGGGWTLDGTKQFAFDYGNLSTGYDAAGNSLGNNGGQGSTYATIEYVFNMRDVGRSIALGDFVGWNNKEVYSMKLEQYDGTGKFGVTTSPYYDGTFNAGSTFDTLVDATFVLNTGVWTLYLNGVSAGTISGNLVWYVNGGAGHVGSYDPRFGTYPVGQVYGVATYARSLSAQEIMTKYQALTAVPEPSACGLLGAGALAAAAFVRRRRRNAVR